MTIFRTARFGLGQVVRSRTQPLQGVVIDADAACATAPPPAGGDQPFYQVFVYGEGGGFIAYVAEDALAPAADGAALTPREEAHWFTVDARGRHAPRSQPIH